MTMDFFLRGEERKRHRLAGEEARLGAETALTAYGTPIAQVTLFKYLGKILTAADDNWPPVVRNLWKARRKWAQMTRVLGREGDDAQTSGQIYLEVVQSVMLYGSETWVMTPRIRRAFGGFHHRVDRRMTGRKPWQGRDGMWNPPPPVG